MRSLQEGGILEKINNKQISINSSQKKAVVYSKWLPSLGGGEMVSCTIAVILRDLGYEVILITGKKVTRDLVKNKLGISLRGIKLILNWNDEFKLKQLTKGCELFFNTSYMDYSFGYAKKNIYYTHFPTSAYDDVKGFLFNNFILPIAAKIFKPIELIDDIQADSIYNGRPAYILGRNTKIALFLLERNKIYSIVFKVFFENFYKSLLESFKVSFENAEVIDVNTYVDHHRNEIKFTYKIKAISETSYLNISHKKLNLHFLSPDRLFLIFPKVSVLEITDNIVIENIYKILGQRIATRLRAGLFVNILQRLKTYSIVLSNSEFTRLWINRYWGIKPVICYPPVDLIFQKKEINFNKKNNWICSVGRFFTLGHGKKQEVLIEAFKRFYDLGNNNWELHLAGGLADDPSTIDYLNKLKKLSIGYPIYFYLNVSKTELETLYRSSKIYWHATGFAEDSDRKPILFEHFGIAPVEAISAGCIPILYNGGGLPEIIKKISLDEDKHLFSTIDQLVKNTVLFSNESNTMEWQKIFSLLIKNFSVQAFKKKLLEVISS